MRHVSIENKSQGGKIGFEPINQVFINLYLYHSVIYLLFFGSDYFYLHTLTRCVVNSSRICFEYTVADFVLYLLNFHG